MTYRVTCDCGFEAGGLTKPQAETTAAAHRDDDHDPDVEEDP